MASQVISVHTQNFFFRSALRVGCYLYDDRVFPSPACLYPSEEFIEKELEVEALVVMQDLCVE